MNDPNHSDTYDVRLQPAKRPTTYWDRCNNLLHDAGAIHERRQIIQRLWKEALDDYDEYADILGVLMAVGFNENDADLVYVMIILEEIDGFILYCEDIDAIYMAWDENKTPLPEPKLVQDDAE
jgi:hypothetical protein